MPESIGTKKIIQGEDIILLVDEKTTLHATSHTLKVDLEMKELRTKDTNGKEKAPGWWYSTTRSRMSTLRKTC